MQSAYSSRARGESGPSATVKAKLSALAPLQGDDIERLDSLRVTERFAAGRSIRAAGDGRPAMRFLLTGWAARQRLMSDGRRQILSIVLPGDALWFGESETGVSLTALTRCEAGDASAVVAAGGAVRGSAGLASALAAADALEQWLMVEQIVRLGQRTAVERSAHLLLELEMRLALAGLASSGTFPLPLTQEVLSDVLGLSVVHVNRTMLQLRREQLIDVQHRTVEVLRRERLARLADFQPPAQLGVTRRTGSIESAAFTYS